MGKFPELGEAIAMSSDLTSADWFVFPSTLINQGQASKYELQFHFTVNKVITRQARLGIRTQTHGNIRDPILSCAITLPFR